MKTAISALDERTARTDDVEVEVWSRPRERSLFGRELHRWSARNSSKGSLLRESVKCLEFLAEGRSIAELYRAVRDWNLLGKRTRETRRACWRLISWRYFTPTEGPVAVALSALARRGSDDLVFRGALYFHFCLADRLTFDVATEFLWDLQRKGREIVSPTEVKTFIRDQVSAHPEVLRWSESTLHRLSGNVLSALRDFGRLSGEAKKRLVQPPLPDELLLYVCKFLSTEGASARAIVTAPEFRLWGRDPREIGARLAQLSRSGAIRFEWSGDIAILDLGEETFDAYARRIGGEVR
ncbi:MAG TPA: BrxA family protein [Chloroflexota bacterium]